jgi:hypothetical protein
MSFPTCSGPGKCQCRRGRSARCSALLGVCDSSRATRAGWTSRCKPRSSIRHERAASWVGSRGTLPARHYSSSSKACDVVSVATLRPCRRQGERGLAFVSSRPGRHRAATDLTELFDCPTPISEGVTEDQAKKVERRSRTPTARRRSSGRGVNVGVGGRTRGFAAVGRKAEEGRFEFGRTKCGASLRLPCPRCRSEPNNLVFR